MHLLHLDLNRQYNSMETDLQTKVDRLEVCVDLLQTQLGESNRGHSNSSCLSKCSLPKHMLSNDTLMTDKAFFWLAECQVQLKSEREQREQREAEKEAIISDLQGKLDSMERECEKIMHVSDLKVRALLFKSLSETSVLCQNVYYVLERMTCFY